MLPSVRPSTKYASGAVPVLVTLMLTTAGWVMLILAPFGDAACRHRGGLLIQPDREPLTQRGTRHCRRERDDDSPPSRGGVDDVRVGAERVRVREVPGVVGRHEAVALERLRLSGRVDQPHVHLVVRVVGQGHRRVQRGIACREIELVVLGHAGERVPTVPAGQDAAEVCRSGRRQATEGHGDRQRRLRRRGDDDRT